MWCACTTMAHAISAVSTSPAHGTSPMMRIPAEPQAACPGTRKALSVRAGAGTLARKRLRLACNRPSRIPSAAAPRPTVKPAPTDASSTRSPFFSRPGADRVVQRQRNRRRRRVAEPLDVDDHLVRVEAELLGRRLDDPAVGLVRDEQIEIVPASGRSARGSRREISSVLRTANLNTAWPSCLT